MGYINRHIDIVSWLSCILPPSSTSRVQHITANRQIWRQKLCYRKWWYYTLRIVSLLKKTESSVENWASAFSWFVRHFLSGNGNNIDACAPRMTEAVTRTRSMMVGQTVGVQYCQTRRPRRRRAVWRFGGFCQSTDCYGLVTICVPNKPLPSSQTLLRCDPL